MRERIIKLSDLIQGAGPVATLFLAFVAVVSLVFFPEPMTLVFTCLWLMAINATLAATALPEVFDPQSTPTIMIKEMRRALLSTLAFSLLSPIIVPAFFLALTSRRVRALRKKSG